MSHMHLARDPAPPVRSYDTRVTPGFDLGVVGERIDKEWVIHWQTRETIAELQPGTRA